MTIKNEEIKRKIIEIVKNEKRPISIGYLAKKLELAWWVTFKIVCDYILEELQKHDPESLKKLEIIPFKTTKDWILISPDLLIKEVEVKNE